MAASEDRILREATDLSNMLAADRRAPFLSTLHRARVSAAELTLWWVLYPDDILPPWRTNHLRHPSRCCAWCGKVFQLTDTNDRRIYCGWPVHAGRSLCQRKAETERQARRMREKRRARRRDG